MVFGRWSDSRHFLYFSVSLNLPQYETVQFLPPPPEVGKPGSSDLMLHEAIYQGLIVRFTLLDVFPSLVCARTKFELSNHSVSLSTQAHMRVVESTLTRVVKHRAHRHLVFYLPSVQLYRSSAAFHTGWCTEVTIICPQLLLFSAPCALSLLVQSFPSPPWSSSQDNGRSPRVDHHYFIFSFFQTYGAISLSHLDSMDNSTSHVFSFTCLRLVSNVCYCFVSVTGLGGSTLLCFNSFCLPPSLLFLRFSYLFSYRCCSDLPFSFPSCIEAQGWGEYCPQPYRRQTFGEIVGIAAKNTVCQDD